MKIKTGEELDVYTVSELLEDLMELEKKGLGNRYVLIPNRSEELEVDYRFLDKGYHIKDDDAEEKCVYLEDFSDEEDDKLSETIFGY